MRFLPFLRLLKVEEVNMPYYARKHQLKNSLLYHIVNRGNARATVFHTDKDYRHFFGLLKEYSCKFAMKVYHWVLMPNHYHLLIELPEPEEISACMAGINRSYTCYYHRTYRTAGFLWQGRFKLQPIQKETHLIACARYIERNPVKAGIVIEAAAYPYSSAKFYCQRRSDGLTAEDSGYSEFGNNAVGRMQAYSRYLHEINDEEGKWFANLEEPLGDKEFINRLIKINGRYMPKRRGSPKKTIVT